MSCEQCGQQVVFACAFHDDHRFVKSHTCRIDGRTKVECRCGAEAWGKDKYEAVATLGGTFDSAGQVWEEQR